MDIELIIKILLDINILIKTIIDIFMSNNIFILIIKYFVLHIETEI